jgi:5-formyltetrahydrofolate cyclo-ligase
MDEKKALRARLRIARKTHVDSLPQTIRALMFLRPPVMVANLAAEGATVAVYHAIHGEAPTRSYAKWFSENGRQVALPWFAEKGAPMEFRLWRNPYDDEELVTGPDGAPQPAPDAPLADPDLVFVPLVGFTAEGQRLGQGGGHYDRWLAANAGVTALGMAWDCQMVESLPTEAHDVPLRAIITPSRLYGEL